MVCAEFDDFDRFSDSRPAWDMDVRQLERGELKASMQQLMSGSFSISRSAFNRRSYHQGASSSVMRSFGLIDDTSPELDWCGCEITADKLVVFPEEGDFRTITPAGFRGYNLAFTNEALRASCDRLGVPNVCESLGKCGEVLFIDPRGASALRHVLNRMLSSWCGSGVDLVGSEPLLGALSEQVADHLVSLLIEPTRLEKHPTNYRLTATANQTLQYIEEHLEHGVSVASVAQASGVNARTLQYAFRRQIGMSPKTFINGQRLALARRELLKCPAGTKISDVANRWGYWHLGQFARDYRKRFGELPSQTSGR